VGTAATRIDRGSGDVFADIGVELTQEEILKLEIAKRISRVIDEQGLTQTAVAKVLDVDQAKVSSLVRGRLDGFSIERLYRFLRVLGWDVRISFRYREGTQGRLIIERDHKKEYA
jgi:predicted XRE-type DNA-binding protein